jgi:hypothetical protein
MTRRSIRLFKCILLTFVSCRLFAADSITVTFRYTDIPGTVVHAFVPGAFNNWGPNDSNRIAPDAPSQMTYSQAGGYYYKGVRLAVGVAYAYKFHLHFDPAGTVYQWITDPFNTVTDGSQFENSLMSVSGLMIFEPEFRKSNDGALIRFLGGIFSTAAVTRVMFYVDSDSTQITSSIEPETGILSYTLPSPLPPGHNVRVVAYDALGRSATVSAVSPVSSSRKLDVTLLFHANQNLVPYGKVADLASFRGLIQTLRKHPSQKFQLHFSAPLIHDLQWFGDSTLQIIREGIGQRQFEIFGSTYAQNIMYSTRIDTGDYEFNNNQIVFQKELIQKVLGVTPLAFWNAERVWTQNFVQLLADNGYKYVPVEDHILQASGESGPVYQPRLTRFNGRQVVAFEDDKTFLGLVDNAINNGDPGPVISFLNAKYAEDTLDQFVIGYYQDAEATGLWDYQNGVDPQTNFNGLDALLTALEADTLIRVTTYEDWLASNPPPPELTPIVDGAAQWMGADAWFTENQRPEFQTMRVVYDSLRRYIDSVGSVVKTFAVDTAANKLIRHAWFTLCAHQFEFGCSGLEGDVYHTQLQLARASAVGAAAALFRVHPGTRVQSMDVNRDGVNEVVVTTSRDLFVFSSSGGRLLYWFDLVKGEELVGNEDFSADYIENYVNDNVALPVIRGGRETYSWLWGNPIFPEVFAWNFIVRKRALNDHLSINLAADSVLENSTYTPNLDSTGVTFTLSTNGLLIRKRLHPTSEGLAVEYHLISVLSSATNVGFEVQNSFSPSYIAVMDNGRTSLGYWDGTGSMGQTVTASTIGVRNAVTGSYVRYQWSTLPNSVTGREDVFALELNPFYTRSVAPGDSMTFGFVLQSRGTLVPVSPGAASPAPDRFELLQNYPNPFNPSTTIRYGLPQKSHVTLSVYNTLGQIVRTLVQEMQEAGFHEVKFDGAGMASGMYFYRIQAGQFAETRKLLLLR